MNIITKHSHTILYQNQTANICANRTISDPSLMTMAVMLGSSGGGVVNLYDCTNDCSRSYRRLKVNLDLSKE